MAPHRFKALQRLAAEETLLKEQSNATPRPYRWRDFFPPLPQLSRPLRVAIGCSGMDYAEYLSEMEVPIEGATLYDIEGQYRQPMHDLFEEIHRVTPNLHIGAVEGDVTKVSLQDVPEVDLLIAGPPCPPWSAQGLKRCGKDLRALVFNAIIEWIIHLAHNRGLTMVILENVKGVLQAIGGFQPFYEKLVQALRQAIPHFHWRFDLLRLLDYRSGQMRERVFLRGSLYSESLG